MKNLMATTAALTATIAAAFTLAQPQTPKPAQSKPAVSVAPAAPDSQPDLAKPTLFVVAYAHLDTQWRWCYPQTIREFIPNTLNDNFKFFEKYPNYVFNFSGSRRYQMMKEYYPEGYERLKTYVASGRWFPCGSSVDENDANVPSAESYVRHILYGNRFFRREFGIASEEYMLPDCFGFPAALPSMLAHCGVKGFSTQKLTWNAAVPIPFKVGVWEGPDGRSVIAALDPGSYGGEVLENLATNDGWRKRIQANGEKSGVFADYHYYGTGDEGGAPTERSVEMMEKSVASGKEEGKSRIISGAADLLVRSITPEMRERLPRYKGELQLTEHSAGSITSEAFMKRMNRKNELLADSAERASVAAAWLGGRAYPSQQLEDAWTLVLGSQMHDILPGTSHPRAYDYAWNDELLAANQFAGVLQDAVGVVAGAMDTFSAFSEAIVVFNPLSIDREDMVEAHVRIRGPMEDLAKSVRVAGPDGKPVPAQIISGPYPSVVFLAKVPAVGFAAFEVSLSVNPGEWPAASSLRVAERKLENEHYLVTLDDNGDVASIRDKKANRELLSAPARLGLHYENPKNWPAWNQDWADREKPAREFVGGPVTFCVAETGPARVAVEVTRELEGSTFTQTIRLSAGEAADRIEFDLDVQWAARERSLRASFPLTVSNPIATYDIQVGALERPNSHAKQFEYASHQWFDLTDAKGDYGVSVMNDSKYGADKPDDHTVRLTLLHTPGTRGGYQDQGTQDLGRHHILYAISGHQGDWRQGKSAQQAARLNQPLVAFNAKPHDGPLGKSFSLVKVSDDNVRISAIKKAEESDEVILRLRELTGHDAKGVRISAAKPILAAREVDGQERQVGTATVRDGALVTDIRAFELRAFAVKLAEPSAKSARPQTMVLDLPFDTDAVSTNSNRADGSMDAHAGTYPAEQLPATLACGDASFSLGPTVDGKKNAVACRAQELQIPSGDFDRLYLLAASSDGDVQSNIDVDSKPVPARFGAWTGMIGQWDRRLWLGDVPERTFGWSNELGGIEPGYVKPDSVAWYCSHHHTPKGDAYYMYCYLYKVAIDLPQGAKSIRLPKDERIKVFAATLVKSGDNVTPASSLSDSLADHVQDAPMVVPGAGTFTDSTDITIVPRMYWRPDAIRYTTDGSDPTASSPAYAAPFVLSKTATIKAAVVGPDGHLGPIASAKVDVNDVTPPTVKRVTPTYKSPVVRVDFSEPLDHSAASAQNFTLDPAIQVASAKKSDDGRSVILQLANPPEVDRTYHLKIAGLKDAAPAHNTMKPATLDLLVKGPVYALDQVTKDQMGTDVRDVPGLPVKAGDSWTLNMFVRTEKQPANRTVIAGFGKCEDSADGIARYLTKFSAGIHFWSRNRDVEGKTPLSLDKWQMLTATYDGLTLRLYKDAKKIGERAVQLADDDNIVHFAPPDPWEKKRRFEGEIRAISIWAAALGDDAIRSLMDAAPQP